MLFKTYQMSLINMMPHILIGPADALSAPEVAWSLIDAGFSVTAYEPKGTTSAIRLIKNVHIAQVDNPKLNAENTIENLISIINKIECNFFLPLDDYAIWLSSQLRLKLPSLHIPLDLEQIEFSLNKWKQFSAAIRVGLLVPETKLCMTKSEAKMSSIKFPCIVKGAMAAACHDKRLTRASSFKCFNFRELSEVVDNWDFSHPMLIQKYIEGNGEGIFGIATQSSIGTWSSHQRVRMMNPNGSGSSACKEITPDTKLLPPIISMLSTHSWCGLFMIEFLRDKEGKAWFMEVNGRPWGSMALARRAGFEYPAWTVLSMLNPDFLPKSNRLVGPHILCRHLGREILHFLFVLNGPKSKLDTTWPEIGHTISSLLKYKRTCHWYNWRKGEPWVFIQDTINTVVAHLIKGIKRQ